MVQRDLERKQEKLREAEAQASAARAELAAALGGNHSGSCAGTDGIVAPPGSTEKVSSSCSTTTAPAQVVLVQQEPILVQDDVEADAMEEEWRREVAVLQGYDESVSFALTKKMTKISNMLSHGNDAKVLIGVKQAAKEKTILVRAGKGGEMGTEEKRKFQAAWKHGREWLELRHTDLEVVVKGA